MKTLVQIIDELKDELSNLQNQIQNFKVTVLNRVEGLEEAHNGLVDYLQDQFDDTDDESEELE